MQASFYLRIIPMSFFLTENILDVAARHAAGENRNRNAETEVIHRVGGYEVDHQQPCVFEVASTDELLCRNGLPPQTRDLYPQLYNGKTLTDRRICQWRIYPSIERWVGFTPVGLRVRENAIDRTNRRLASCNRQKSWHFIDARVASRVEIRTRNKIP